MTGEEGRGSQHRTMVLKVWPLDQQPQQHLGPC